ncbi:hypothetical protein HanIR_Chr13g0623671 [Helianthus annuus]|nr:hypothetical protein HanIR_Chr13g0623671 [Helianthus annuus]
MFEGRNLRFTKDFRMCFVMNRLRFVKRLTDVRRTKSEVYEGFSHVFCDESTQVVPGFGQAVLRSNVESPFLSTKRCLL